jgi:hypothetical protein
MALASRLAERIGDKRVTAERVVSARSRGEGAYA